MNIQPNLVRTTAVVDNVLHFEKPFPWKECGSRENDSKVFQSEKCFSDREYWLRLLFILTVPHYYCQYLKNATTFWNVIIFTCYSFIVYISTQARD